MSADATVQAPRRSRARRIGAWAIRVTTASALVGGALAAIPIGSAGAARSAVPNRFSTFPVKGSSVAGFPAVPTRTGRNVNITNKNGAQSETAIAVDPTNTRHLLAASNDLSNFSSYSNVWESMDGGRTWVSAGFSVAAFCYDPWLAFNNAGDAFFGYECSDQRIAYRKAGTTNWVYTKLTNAGSFPDRDQITVDNSLTSPFGGSVYIGYDDNGNFNSAHIMYSRDGFGNWVQSPKINDNCPTTQCDIGVNVTATSDGTVHATWEDFVNGVIKTDESTDGGATWGTDHQVTDLRINTTSFFISIPPQNIRGVLPMPFTASAPEGSTCAGRMYVAYMDKAVTTANTNIYFRYSDDNGTTWSAEQQLNDDTVNAYHFFPAIAVAPSGTIGVSFYDTRNDSANKKTDQYFTSSSDCGVTWAANQRVTTASSDETGPGVDGNQYGDYEGIAAHPQGFFQPTWTDSRVGSKNEDQATTQAK